jgi:hypothetical protein
MQRYKDPAIQQGNVSVGEAWVGVEQSEDLEWVLQERVRYFILNLNWIFISYSELTVTFGSEKEAIFAS